MIEPRQKKKVPVLIVNRGELFTDNTGKLTAALTDRKLWISLTSYLSIIVVNHK